MKSVVGSTFFAGLLLLGSLGSWADQRHLKITGYFDDEGLVGHPAVFPKTVGEGNTIFVHARTNPNPVYNDFENFKNSPYLNSSHKLILFTDIYSAHLHKYPWVVPIGSLNLPEDLYVREKIRRVVAFLRGDFTDGRPMWNRVVAIQLADEPVGPLNASLSVPDLALDWLVTYTRGSILSIGTKGLVIPAFMINYYLDGTANWSSHVPAKLDWVATDPYMYPAPGHSTTYSDFQSNVITWVKRAESYGKPVVIIAQSFGERYSTTQYNGTGPWGCAGGFSEVARQLTLDEETWYYKYAQQESQVVGLLWWTYLDKANWDAKPECFVFMGSANHNPAVANLHKQWTAEIDPVVGPSTQGVLNR